MSYPKNTNSPRRIYARVLAAADRSPITSGVAAYHLQGTTRSAGAGVLTHIAGGLWSYLPLQAETAYDTFAIEFYHADAEGLGPVEQVYTDDVLAGANQNFSNNTAYNTDGYEVTTGAWVSGTAADTTSLGTRLVFRPSGTEPLDVNFGFELGSARPSELLVRGYYAGTTGATNTRYASVYAFDYAASDWALLSDAGNRIAQGTANAAYVYVLQPQHQDPATGTVKIRYVSNPVNANDRLYLDLHLVAGVLVGPTVGEVAEAVWVHNIRNRTLDGTHTSAGYFLSRTATEWGLVSSVSGNVVVVAGDYFNETHQIYNGRLIQFHKAGEQTYEVARIVQHDGPNTLTLDRELTLVQSSGWHCYILPEVATTWSDTLPEAYAGIGKACTPAQLFYMLLARMFDRDIDSGEWTFYELDGTTPALRFQLSFDLDGKPIGMTRIL